MTEVQSRAEKQPREEPQRKRRWRLNFDSITAQWPLSGGLTLSGAGVLGVVVVVLGWYVFHQPQVEVPNLAGIPRAAAEAQLSNKVCHATERPERHSGILLAWAPRSVTVRLARAGVV